MQLPSLSRVLLFSSLCTSLAMEAAVTQKETKTMTKTAKTPKIAVANIHKIITVDPKALPMASDEWRSLYNKLQDTLKPANAEIEAVEAKYKKKISEIETLQKSGVASKETLQKKYGEEVAPLEYQLQNQYQQRERFAQEELAKAQSVIGPKIEKVIREIKKNQGWNMILKGDAALGDIDEDFDVTNDILISLNKNYAEEQAEKAKKADLTKKK